MRCYKPTRSHKAIVAKALTLGIIVGSRCRMISFELNSELVLPRPKFIDVPLFHGPLIEPLSQEKNIRISA